MHKKRGKLALYYLELFMHIHTILSCTARNNGFAWFLVRLFLQEYAHRKGEKFMLNYLELFIHEIKVHKLFYLLQLFANLFTL
jgi:hypothetical protein